MNLSEQLSGLLHSRPMMVARAYPTQKTAGVRDVLSSFWLFARARRGRADVVDTVSALIHGNLTPGAEFLQILLGAGLFAGLTATVWLAASWLGWTSGFAPTWGLLVCALLSVQAGGGRLARRLLFDAPFSRYAAVSLATLLQIHQKKLFEGKEKETVLAMLVALSDKDRVWWRFKPQDANLRHRRHKAFNDMLADGGNHDLWAALRSGNAKALNKLADEFAGLDNTGKKA